MKIDKKEPKEKYFFDTGKKIEKVKKIGYRYLGKGEVGELRKEIIDKKVFYYVKYHLGRSSLSKNKSNFKRVEYFEEEIGWSDNWVEKKTPKNKLVFDTRIGIPKDKFLISTDIKLGKESLNFFRISESDIIRNLQLKKGDNLKVTIEVMKRK